MESELLRMGKGTYDLSEMFIVRQKYMNQLQDNYVRQGRGNIGQGSLSHTFMNAFNQVGIVPEEVYSGINYDSDRHNHAEMVKYIKAIATTAVDMKKRSPEYYKLIDNLFDTYLGKLPEKFTYQGKEYTPKTFAASLGLNMDDYIELLFQEWRGDQPGGKEGGRLLDYRPCPLRENGREGTSGGSLQIRETFPGSKRHPAGPSRRLRGVRHDR